MKFTAWLSDLLRRTCQGWGYRDVVRGFAFSRRRRWRRFRTGAHLPVAVQISRLEERVMLSAATLAGGVLTIDFTATGATTESVALSSDGTTISLTGVGFTGTSTFSAADVNRISVRDLGGSSAQSLTLGGAALSLNDGFSSIGVESFTGNSGIHAGSAAVEVAADNIAISSTGSITTTNTVLLRGSSAARAISLGAEDASRLSLTDAELDRITAGLVQIGSAASTGFISVRDNLSQANHLALMNNVASSSLVNIEFLGGITMAADKDLSVTALGGPRPIETFNAIVISTSGTGSLSMTASTGIVLRGGTTVTTEHGDLTLSANLSGTDSGLYSGVFLNGAIVETRGTGDIRLTGRGSLGSASGSQVDGVRIVGASVVRSVSATNLPTQGEIVIDGTGGRGAGITIDPFGAPGDRINSQGGNITLLGRGGNAGSGTQAYGVNLGNGPRVIAANNASITILGTGGIGGSSPGVAVGGATVQSANGSITIQGTGGTTTSFSSNSGIVLTGATILSTNGEISLSGNGGSSTSSNYGINSNSSSIRSTTNKVSLVGAGGSGASSFGLWLDNNTPIFSGLSVEAVADSLNLPGSFFADMFSAPLVSIRPLTAGTPIQPGSGDVLSGASKALGLSSFEFGRIAATTLRIGDTTSGTISVVGTGVTPSADRAWNVELISGGDIVFNAPFSTVGFASASAPTRGNLLLAPGPTGGVKPKSTTNDAVTQTNLGSAFTTSFASGSDLKIAINGLTAHTQYDRLTILGRVNLAGADLALSGSYVSSLGNVFTIVSAGNVTGTFNGLPENSFVLFNGRVLRVNYTSTTATLTDVGMPASIVPQYFSLPENTTLAGTVQSSPLPIVGETRTYAIVGSGPDDGLFTITPQGVLSFLAPPDYEAPNDVGGTSGDNSYLVSVRVTDRFGFSQVATMTVEVLPVNDAPVATDDTATVNEDGSVTIEVLANDADSEGDSLTLVSVGAAAHGTAVLQDDGTVTYTPATDFFGIDEFTYVVSDGQGGVDNATVRVTVRSRPDVVFAGRIYEDQLNDGVSNGSDSGLAGITVLLFEESNLSTPLATAVTDSNGGYRFVLPVGAGTYRIVRSNFAGLLDGDEVAGTLGGVVDNATDSRTIGAITVTADTGDVAANGYDFGMLRPSRIQGAVFEDANQNGEFELGEPAIAGVTVRLTGIDDRGGRVDRVLQTNAQGVFEFHDLRPSDANGYTLTETQPTGYSDGQDTLGTINGVVVGDYAMNDVFRRIVMTQSGSAAINYNFGEVRPSSGTVQPGQTATIGFWQNKNGQALILSLNGGPSSKKLSSWLASTFPNLYGVCAGSNNLTGMTNAQVAAFYKTIFKRTGSTREVSGPPKVDAQFLAAALAAYVTNENLAGQAAKAYGFTVNAAGVGGALFNVGANGAAFGVANGSDVRVMDLLLAVNARSRRGRLFDMNGDGDTIDPKETEYRVMANVVFSAVNEEGDIR